MRLDCFVFDTNIFISAALLAGGVNDRALDYAFIKGSVTVSNDTLDELKEVLFRKKFDRYLTDKRRLDIIQKIEAETLLFVVTTKLTDCRDPKDNKFLELAVDAKASCIITGDKDLLILHPFRGIQILSPADFLSTF